MLYYQDLAFRTAYLIIRDAAEAEDVMQDAFVKAYRALPRFRSGWPFRPWLLRIVANEARNRQISAGRRTALLLRVGARTALDDASPSPESAAVSKEQHQILLQAVNMLPEADQLVITCRYFLELSEAEMATLLECPKGTVKSRLSRALGRLREVLMADADVLDVGVARD